MDAFWSGIAVEPREEFIVVSERAILAPLPYGVIPLALRLHRRERSEVTPLFFAGEARAGGAPFATRRVEGAPPFAQSSKGWGFAFNAPNFRPESALDNRQSFVVYVLLS